MKGFDKKWALVFLFLAVFLSVSIRGQTTASIYGTITDSQQGVLPGATVTVTNVLTNESRTADTNEVGNYNFLNLSIGMYKVQAGLPGFKTTVQEGIELSLNRNAKVDIKLEIGELAETVSVHGDAPLVEATTNEMGALVDQRRVAQLPLNGRNTLSLISLIPGAQRVESRTEQGFNINPVSVNGARPELSNMLLDGGDNTSTLRNYGSPVPNPDAIQEFRVVTNNYSAESGRSVGAIINVVTKSGTNEFHGSAFEYLRNDALNGDNFFKGAPDKLNQHTFGGTVGGRIIKDKTFFFASFQGYRRSRERFANKDLVPTELERRGDFTQSVFKNGPVVYDPLTHAPFPGNVIPASRISPIATKFLDMVVPLPNNPEGGPNNYTTTHPLSDPANEVLGKIDHALSANHKLSGSYFLNDSVIEESVSEIPYQYRDNTNRQHNLNIHEYWTITPTLLNHVRASYSRNAASRALRSEPKITANDLGISYGNLPSGPPVAPGLSPSGYFTTPAQAGGPKTSNNYTVAEGLDWMKGRHSLKFGGEVWLRRFHDITQDARSGGEFKFNGNATNNSIADLLLGQVSDRFRYRETSYKSNNQWAFYWFAQDNVRVSNRLSLTLGVRHEIDMYPVHPLDLVVAYVPGMQSGCVPQAPAGIVFPCDPGIPRAGLNNDYNNFAPRIGLAYDLKGDGRTVLRGGYGVTYAFQIFNTLQGGQINTPWALIEEKTNGAPKKYMSQIQLADPWASVGGNPLPIKVDPANLKFPAGSIYSANALDLPVGLVHQYNFSIQQQLGASTVVELSYVGNQGRGLIGEFNINQAVLSPTGTSDTANLNSRRPMQNPSFKDFNNFKSVVPSWYDSMQARVEKRFGRGYSVLGSYTFGKAMDWASWHASGSSWSDPRHPEFNKALADYDRRQSVSVSFLWDLPFFNQSGRLARSLLGGWQLSGIASYYSGAPVDVTVEEDTNKDGVSGNERPNLVGNWKIDPPSASALKAGATWFDLAAFEENGVGEMGTFGRNGLTGPSFRNVDLSLAKRFRISEQHAFSLRLETYNLLNTVNLDSPEADFTDMDFGEISTCAPARIFQVGLRYDF